MTLTNAQTGDVLSLQGQAGTSGTLAGGIGFSISGSTVTFSNVSLLANYQAALQLVQFNNTSGDPDHDGPQLRIPDRRWRGGEQPRQRDGDGDDRDG